MLLYKVLIDFINGLVLVLLLIIIVKINLFINGSRTLLNNCINKKGLCLVVAVLKPNILN